MNISKDTMLTICIAATSIVMVFIMFSFVSLMIDKIKIDVATIQNNDGCLFVRGEIVETRLDELPVLIISHSKNEAGYCIYETKSRWSGLIKEMDEIELQR